MTRKTLNAAIAAALFGTLAMAGCKKKAEEVPPPAVVPPVAEVPAPGEQLPVTGSPLAAQAALGLLLVALGRMLRRRSQTAA